MTALDRLADRLTGGALSRLRHDLTSARSDRDGAFHRTEYHKARAEHLAADLGMTEALLADARRARLDTGKATRDVYAALTARGHLVQDGETVATAVARALDAAAPNEGRESGASATTLLGAVLSRFRAEGDTAVARVGHPVLTEWHRRYAVRAVGAGHPAATEPEDVPYLRGRAYTDTVATLVGWLHPSRTGVLRTPLLTELVGVLDQHIGEGSVGAPDEEPGTDDGDLIEDEERLDAEATEQAS